MKCIGKITIVRASMKQIIDKKWKSGNLKEIRCAKKGGLV